jgi:hypothetical protein
MLPSDFVEKATENGPKLTGLGKVDVSMRIHSPEVMYIKIFLILGTMFLTIRALVARGVEALWQKLKLRIGYALGI